MDLSLMGDPLDGIIGPSGVKSSCVSCHALCRRESRRGVLAAKQPPSQQQQQAQSVILTLSAPHTPPRQGFPSAVIWQKRSPRQRQRQRQSSRDRTDNCTRMIGPVNKCPGLVVCVQSVSRPVLCWGGGLFGDQARSLSQSLLCPEVPFPSSSSLLCCVHL